jgi:D-alanyl-D-alanine carboxypeptidase
MTEQTGFHVASVGKMLTAVIVLQLWEEGRLGPSGLDTPIREFAVLQDLLIHVPALVQAPVTVRQMLNHSSGLRDAFSDDGVATAATSGGRPAPRALATRLRRSPPVDHGRGGAWPAWRPDRVGDPEAGVLNWFIWGARAGERLVHKPGRAFHYSDTAYMILALLAERLGHQTFEGMVTERILSPLQMSSTFLAYGQAAPRDWRAEVSDFDFGGRAAFSDAVDVSWDWGGGGQVSTASDLELLLRALDAGRLFQRAETTAEMRAFRSLRGMPAGCKGLGLGVRRLRSPLGVELWGHAGAWSVQAFYAPAFDATVTGTFNQPMSAGDFMRSWIFRVADSLAELRELDSQIFGLSYL